MCMGGEQTATQRINVEGRSANCHTKGQCVGLEYELSHTVEP